MWLNLITLKLPKYTWFLLVYNCMHVVLMSSMLCCCCVLISQVRIIKVHLYVGMPTPCGDLFLLNIFPASRGLKY